MSTVPNRRTSTQPEKAEASPAKSRRRKGASYQYGYREVPIKRPNGEFDTKRVPLTLNDVLHPRFGDVHVLSDAHGDDCSYLRSVLKERFASDLSVAVFYDVGIFWDVPRMRHHSPDLSVIFGVKERKDWITFDVKTEGVRPRLIIEVTSPATRSNDLKKKVQQYAKVSVPYYVIADATEKDNRRRLTLIAYRLDGGHYVRVALDDRGRAWLEPVGLWLGVTADRATGGDRLALIDPANNEAIGDYTAIAQARAQAMAHSREAETQAHEAEGRAATEAHARALAEARIRELEAELLKLRRGSS